MGCLAIRPASHSLMIVTRLLTKCRVAVPRISVVPPDESLRSSVLRDQSLEASQSAARRARQMSYTVLFFMSGVASLSVDMAEWMKFQCILSITIVWQPHVQACASNCTMSGITNVQADPGSVPVKPNPECIGCGRIPASSPQGRIPTMLVDSMAKQTNPVQRA